MRGPLVSGVRRTRGPLVGVIARRSFGPGGGLERAGGGEIRPGFAGAEEAQVGAGGPGALHEAKGFRGRFSPRFIQDQRDAESLFRVLEDQVVPMYYDQSPDGIPHRWMARVKRSMRTLAWRFNADRMVMDYVRNCYLPAAVASSCQMPPA